MWLRNESTQNQNKKHAKLKAESIYMKCPE